MIVIMGPGRTGTTYLIEMFHALGVDSDGHLEIFREIPKEIKVQGKDFVWPEIIKGTGTLCMTLKEKSDYYGWDIEHILLCYRKLESAVNSRLARNPGGVYRGMSQSEKQKAFEYDIPFALGYALHQIAFFDCDVTLVKFPRSAEDLGYLYSIFEQFEYTYEEVVEAHEKVVDPGKLRFGG